MKCCVPCANSPTDTGRACAERARWRGCNGGVDPPQDLQFWQQTYGNRKWRKHFPASLIINVWSHLLASWLCRDRRPDLTWVARRPVSLRSSFQPIIDLARETIENDARELWREGIYDQIQVQGSLSLKRMCNWRGSAVQASTP